MGLGNGIEGGLKEGIKFEDEGGGGGGISCSYLGFRYLLWGIGGIGGIG